MNEMTDSQGEPNKRRDMGPAEVIARLGPPHPLPTRPQLLLLYADALGEVGLNKRALEVFEVLAKTPVSEGNKHLLPRTRGRVHMNMGRHLEAETDFREAVVLYPDRSTSAWIQLAGSQAYQERFADAVETLKAATGLSGDPEEVHLNLGMSLRTLGRLEEAAENLRQALAIDPEYKEALEVLQDVERALSSEHRANWSDVDEMTDSDGERIKWEEMGPAEIIARLGPPHPLPTRGRLLMEYADALRMVGLHKRALESLEAMANTSVLPWDRKYLLPLCRAGVYLNMGRLSEAETELREAVVLDPDRTTYPLIRLAAAQALQERFADAVETLQAAIGLSGALEEVYLNLGMHLRTLGRLPEAADNLRKALVIDPEYQEAREVLQDVERALLVTGGTEQRSRLST